MLTVGGDHRFVGSQRLHHADRIGFLADVQMQEPADLLLRVQLGALLLEAADQDHPVQQLAGVLARQVQLADRSAAHAAPSMRGSVALGQPQFARLDQPAHDLARAGLGQVGTKFDFARRHRHAQPLARVRQQVPAQRLVRLESLLERDEGLDHLERHRIGHADHRRFGHCGMLHQHALDLERTDQVPRGLDHVVAAADEPEIAVGVTLHQVAAAIPAIDEATPVAFILTEIAAEHRRPARPEHQLTLLARPVDQAQVLFIHQRDRSLDAGQRPAHGTGLDRHAGEVGDHDPAGLGLPPVVMDRQAERRARPRPPPRGSAARRRWR